MVLTPSPFCLPLSLNTPVREGSAVCCPALDDHAADLTGHPPWALQMPRAHEPRFSPVLIIRRPSESQGLVAFASGFSPNALAGWWGDGGPPPPGAPRTSLTAVCISHHGDHRKLPPSALPSQETPFLPKSVQGLPNLQLLVLQQAPLHLHERFSYTHPTRRVGEHTHKDVRAE